MNSSSGFTTYYPAYNILTEQAHWSGRGFSFDAELIAVFFATVHLGTDEAKILTWMSNGRLLSAPWKSFMHLVNIEDKGLETPLGYRPHHECVATHKQALYKYNTDKISSTTRKSTWVLEPFLDIVHHIFRHTLFPHVGNLDQVHSYLVDMLLYYEFHKFKVKVKPQHFSHVMWYELRSVVSQHKCPIYSPFLMHLIQKTWADTFPSD